MQLGGRETQLIEELKLIFKWQWQFQSSMTEQDYYVQNLRKGQLVREILELCNLCGTVTRDRATFPCALGQLIGCCPQDLPKANHVN